MDLILSIAQPMARARATTTSRKFIGKIVVRGQPHAMIGQIADVAGASPELVGQGGGHHLIDGAVHPFEAGGQDDVLLLRQRVVLVGIHADGPFFVFFGGGDCPVAGNGAGAENDIRAVGDEVGGHFPAALEVLKAADVVAHHADFFAFDGVVMFGAVAEAHQKLIDDSETLPEHRYGVKNKFL